MSPLLALSVGVGLVGLAVLYGPADPGRSRRASEWVAHRYGAARPSAVVGAGIGVGALGGGFGWAFFGSALPAIGCAIAAAATPLSTLRRRAEHRREEVAAAWPRVIEEIRVLTASSGRPIPQALFSAMASGPCEIRDAGAAAAREWTVSTDLERALAVMQDALADPTADAVAETLLVAHRVGGVDLRWVLAELAEDRIRDVQERRDARARQAGAIFARRFVVLVPLGMAFAGMSIGDGRAAFASPSGQAVTVLAMAVTAGCWWWAGRLLALPGRDRVYGS